MQDLAWIQFSGCSKNFGEIIMKITRLISNF